MFRIILGYSTDLKPFRSCLMGSGRFQPNGSEYILAVLRLHVVTIIYNLCLRELFTDQKVIRGIHIHSYCFDFRKIFHRDFFEESCKISLRTSFPYPNHIACI